MKGLQAVTSPLLYWLLTDLDGSRKRTACSVHSSSWLGTAFLVRLVQNLMTCTAR
jgi:hypothetical protein